MIDSKELRTGNYVSHHSVFDTKDFVYAPLERTDFCDLSYLKKCKPIPLTEEWLLRFGFDININENSKCGHSKLKGFSLWMSNGKIIYHTNHGMTVIKYVHQLQNLYYALTGKELIKTKE